MLCIVLRFVISQHTKKWSFLFLRHYFIRWGVFRFSAFYYSSNEVNKCKNFELIQVQIHRKVKLEIQICHYILFEFFFKNFLSNRMPQRDTRFWASNRYFEKSHFSSNVAIGSCAYSCVTPFLFSPLKLHLWHIISYTYRLLVVSSSGTRTEYTRGMLTKWTPNRWGTAVWDRWWLAWETGRQTRRARISEWWSEPGAQK